MLEGKVAIITGAAAARGIGFATAQVLSGYGAKVVLADLAEPDVPAGETPQLEQRAHELRNGGADAIACAVDVTRDDEIAACVAQANETHGGVDILFNNAGVTVGFGPFLETPIEAWDLQFRIHIAGIVAFCKAVIPSMQVRGGGSIINTSSIWALKAHEYASIYTTTKLGLIGVTKTIAVEHGRDNIRCNAVMPGPIRTDMQDRRVVRDAETFGISQEEARARIGAPLAMKRVGEPHEIGEVVAFLASPMASFITGAAIPVDGGNMEGL